MNVAGQILSYLLENAIHLWEFYFYIWQKVIEVCVFAIHVIQILHQDWIWSTLTDNFETGSGNKQVEGSSQNIMLTTEQLTTYSESKHITEETSTKPILTTIKTSPMYQAVNASNENTGILLSLPDFDKIDSSNIEFNSAPLNGEQFIDETENLMVHEVINYSSTDDVFILSIESDLGDHKYLTYIQRCQRISKKLPIYIFE